MSISASTFSLYPQHPSILPFSDSQSTVFSSSTHVCFHLSRSTEATAPCRRFVNRFISTTSETTDPGQRRPSGWTLDHGSPPSRTSFPSYSSLRLPFLHGALQVVPNGYTLWPPLQAGNLLFAWQSPIFKRLICHMGHWLDAIHDPSTLLSKCGLPPTGLPFSMTC